MIGPRKIEVPTSTGAYDVTLGSGVLADVGRVTSQMIGPRIAALVTDETVGPLYAETVAASLADAGIMVVEIRVPAGEGSKSWGMAGEILEGLAAAGLGRTDAIVALGGGVVGDLAGYCASAYMRGIRFVQVPTTLLAQVDSSVGGKTAVDLVAGKNLAGAFHPPAAVVADIETLASLDDDAWADGSAEIVKTAFLAGDPFLSRLERDIGALGDRDVATVFDTIVTCVEFKSAVVAADEREGGAREQLNLGHTLAHARERLEAYAGVSHGVAVAEGLRFAAFLGEYLSASDESWTIRQLDLIEAACIPVPKKRHGIAELIDAMHADKKARAGVVRFVLSTGPGRFEVVPVEDETLADALGLWESANEGT